MPRVWKAKRRDPIDELVVECELAFLNGYRMAIEDIDRTGLHPLTERTIRESAERALRRVKMDR